MLAIAQRAVALPRVEARPRTWLCAIVVGSAAVRLVLAALVPGPLYFPDEYLYAMLARGLADGSGLTVHGQPVAMPALLTSVVTAPAWLVSSVPTAFRIAQAEGVVAMSAAAVPVYLLARRVRLDPRAALLAALLAVSVPDMMYSGLLLSEPYAYPLFFAALCAALDALTQPTPRRQVVFVAAAAVLCLARSQFVVLFGVYVVSAAVLAWRARDSSRFRAHRVVHAVLLLGALAAVAVGPARASGAYRGVFDFELGTSELPAWIAANAAALAIAAGWLIVPGAALAFARGLRGSGPEAVFCLLSLLAAGALLVESAVFGEATGQLLERYVFYAAPLVGIAFLVAARDGLLRERRHLHAAGLLAAVAVLLPLTRLFFTNDDHAPALLALEPLDHVLGDAAPLAVGAALALLALAAAGITRVGAPAAIVAVSLLGTAAGAGATAFASAHSHTPGGEATVDALRLRDTTLVAFAGFDQARPMKTLFWNRDVTRAVGVDRALPDPFATIPATIGHDGSLLVDGAPAQGTFALDLSGAAVAVRGGRTIANDGLLRVVRADGGLRLAALVDGYLRPESMLGGSGRVRVWAARPRGRLDGSVALVLRAPTADRTGTLVFTDAAGWRWTVRIGRSWRRVVVPIHGRGAWSCTWEAGGVVAGGRVVSALVRSLVVRTSDGARIEAGSPDLRDA